MYAAVVVPGDEFGEYTPKMPLIPDQHPVETLPAKRPYQPLNVCRRVGCAVRNRYPPNAHFLPEPLIECGSTRHPLPCVLNSQRTSELAKLPVIVVKQELGLLLEAGVPYLLFRPFEGRMIGYMQVDDLPTCNLHDDEHVKDPKPDRVLHKEVTGHMDLAWFFKKVFQAWESVGPGRLLTMYLRTVEQA